MRFSYANLIRLIWNSLLIRNTEKNKMWRLFCLVENLLEPKNTFPLWKQIHDRRAAGEHSEVVIIISALLFPQLLI